MFNFKKEVIERSFTKPVLVDFWAPWCGPCRVLSPVLEQLAAEQSDRWELVKINTEEHPDLAQQYQIMSIPNVKLFHKGEAVNEFAGALPKSQLEKWLAENIPDPSAMALQDLIDEANRNPEPATLAKLRQYAEAHPEKKEARLALAKIIVFQNPEEAVELAASVNVAEPLYDDAEEVRTLAALVQFEPENGAAAGGKLLEAKLALQNDDPESAIQKIIEATMLDKNYRDDLPRRSAIALFHTWGSDHELTKKYRRRFDMALY